MVYVALLRGINVGGKNKIAMKQLKETFHRLGLESVVTYINSGNVIFFDEQHSKEVLENKLRQEICKEYDLDIPVLIRSLVDFEDLMQILPEDWKNDEMMKCDVLFLETGLKAGLVMTKLTVKPDIDNALQGDDVIIWSVQRKNVTRSSLTKIVGTELYKKMTVRNVNTARKLYELMKNIEKLAM
ncbi:DUF1697 domain-containing protein [Acetobacterium woodii]|uniref:DUF1697 domain-containing protein n=1 Tax=Acetobacterium woodii (strain ATCC 29683 / DSM 1030 / JCM 2381 / KCTC 1655 / WB1) TaxID=931626 RepID=H6LHM1_ACEWD|nr:DUF1697 domain-containing protein [Acetobacterium woodii]AFA47200.1 hypothetical protein Awo_c03990 [Acetobacterium woodii DSM 1030]